MYQTSSTSAGIFQALLAQGGQDQLRHYELTQPSSPARAGQPVTPSHWRALGAFQPYTSWVVSAQYIRNRQPSFHAASATPLFRINFEIIET